VRHSAIDIFADRGEIYRRVTKISLSGVRSARGSSALAFGAEQSAPQRDLAVAAVPSPTGQEPVWLGDGRLAASFHTLADGA
jgi:hypothetical protein